MNPLIHISITLHFEVMNSEMFGGEGSVGYTSVAHRGISNLDGVNDEFIESQKKITANLLHVSVEDITLISKEAYDFATEGDEDEGDWDDPDDY